MSNGKNALPAAAAEQRILRLSSGVTVIVSLFGVVFGLLSGSLSIVFYGVFAAIDCPVEVELAAAGQEAVDRVQERVGAEQHQRAAYAVTVCIVCFGMFFYELRANRRIGSDFVQRDAQSWLMSAAITSALLVAFAIARSLKGTRFGHLTPYADPVVLALLTLGLVFVPIRTVRKALREILLIAPPEPDAHVRRVMDDAVARHGFKTYPSYVAKVGRAQFLEIHIAVPTAMRLDNVATVDAIRREIAEAIGGEGPQRWLTIDFTADPRWL